MNNLKNIFRSTYGPIPVFLIAIILFPFVCYADINFILINADTDQDLGLIQNNETIFLSDVGNALNIRAEVNSQSGFVRVRFILNNDIFNEENYAPYALAGDIRGDYRSWLPKEGKYTLSALAYNERSVVVESGTVEFEVLDSDTDDQFIFDGNVDTTIIYNSEFNRNRDLISLHFDHCADPDDGHATVADKIITAYYDLDPHVVSGTYGNQPAQYQKDSERVMNAAWGNNGWLNAHQNWNNAVTNTASVWSRVLAEGGQIWIAEGGQSDFSADVVRQLRQYYSSETTKTNIHIIQHSAWNEKYTRSYNLTYVKNNTNYVKIADGNEYYNGTAGLLIKPGSSTNNRKIASFVETAKASSYRSIWEAAFYYLNPFTEKLDFSDSVELLHILGISTGDVDNCADYAEMFLAH